MKRKIQHLAAYITLFTLLVAAFFGAGGKTQQAQALSNGLALTPPMGWNSWNNFGCNVSDTMIRGMVDAMVSKGMLAAGYTYVNIDDCWQNTTRTNGHVTATSNFPSGIKAVADYAHSKGLKLGVYSDHGTATCAGRAGSYSYETTDANDYASWGVDYLKYDNCNLPSGDNAQTDYTNMKNALAASGRAITYSICAWSYQGWMPSVGNLWRTTGDISDSWSSMYAIPNTNNASAASAAPGAWNDPDMLEVGRGGMTDTEYHTHFGWWAIMAAPLIAGNDIRSQSAATTAILEAPEIIAVDQDPAGHQGTRVWDGGNGLNIWSKTQSGTNTRAVFLVNGGSSAANITVNWSQIGLPAGNATVRDLWSRTDLGTFTSYTASNIPSHGSVMLKIVSSTGSPTNTPTRTPTQGTGPTATPTRTLTPGGPTPTFTITPTPGSGSCSPVTSTLTVPFTYDGAGTFCWQSSNLGSYINSWNITSLAVNGVNETNLYVASGSYPAKINGYWYVSYNSTVTWGHFEAK